MKPNHEVLFSVSIQLPNDINTPKDGTVDNDTFNIYKKIINKTVDTLYMFSLKNIFSTKRYDDNIKIIQNHGKLYDNTIFVTVTFQFPERFYEKKDETIKLFIKYIRAATRILDQEKKYAKIIFRKIEFDRNEEIIRFQNDGETLTVLFKYEEIIELANKIEEHRNDLFKNDSLDNIIITIGNISIELPKLKMKTSRLTTSNLSNSEVHAFRFISTIDLERPSAFIVELQSSPKRYKLLHVCQDYRKELQRAAKHNDTLELEVYRIIEIIRSVIYTKNSYKFVGKASNSEPIKQLSLFANETAN